MKVITSFTGRRSLLLPQFEGLGTHIHFSSHKFAPLAAAWSAQDCIFCPLFYFFEFHLFALPLLLL